MATGTVLSNPNGVDLSFGHTDAKEHQNLLAQTADGKVVKKGLYKATLNPACLVDAAGETIQITGCTGVLLGKTAVVGLYNPYDLTDVSATAYVQADGVIEIRIQNESTAVVNLASGVWYVETHTIAPNL